MQIVVVSNAHILTYFQYCHFFSFHFLIYYLFLLPHNERYHIYYDHSKSHFPDEPKEHPNNTTPENWSLDLHEKFSEEDYKGPERRIDPGDSVSAYGLSLPKEKVHYADEYNSQLLPELERQWKIRGESVLSHTSTLPIMHYIK